MKLRPLHALITLKMDEAPEFDGMIAIPIFAREELDVGTVVGAGSGETDSKGKFTPCPVKEGDRVLIAKGSGIKMLIDHDYLLFITPNEVTGIIKGNV